MFVIQSAFTGCFLAPDPEDGQPVWVQMLKDAHSVSDLETAVEIIKEHIDDFHKCVITDLREI